MILQLLMIDSTNREVLKRFIGCPKFDVLGKL